MHNSFCCLKINILCFPKGIFYNKTQQYNGNQAQAANCQL